MRGIPPGLVATSGSVQSARGQIVGYSAAYKADTAAMHLTIVHAAVIEEVDVVLQI